MHRSVSGSVSLSSLLVLAACGGSPAPAVAPPPVAPVAAPPVVAAPAAGGDVDPGFVAASGAPAARVVASYDGPLAQGLKETSAWFAPGMTAEGPTYTATLAEKGHAKTDVTLRGGRCYVVVGFSRDGQVIDFDLRVWRVPKGTLLGEDFDDDTTPTIGKPPICLDTDAPVLVELFADKGKGDVAVQVYSKPR